MVRTFVLLLGLPEAEGVSRSFDMVYMDSAGYGEFMKSDDADNGAALKSLGLAKCEARRAACVGWVERSEAHQLQRREDDGFRLRLYPSYGLNVLRPGCLARASAPQTGRDSDWHLERSCKQGESDIRSGGPNQHRKYNQHSEAEGVESSTFDRH